MFPVITRPAQLFLIAAGMGIESGLQFACMGVQADAECHFWPQERSKKLLLCGLLECSIYIKLQILNAGLRYLQRLTLRSA